MCPSRFRACDISLYSSQKMHLAGLQGIKGRQTPPPHSSALSLASQLSVPLVQLPEVPKSQCYKSSILIFRVTHVHTQFPDFIPKTFTLKQHIMDGLSTAITIIPVAISCFDAVCQLISDYRSFQGDVEDFICMKQVLCIRLEQVHYALNCLSTASLSNLHIATISGLLHKLATLHDQMERKLLKAKQMGARKWALTRYSSKLLQMVRDLEHWLDETDRTLLILNRDNLNVIPRSLTTWKGGQLPLQLQLQCQASSVAIQFRERPVEIQPDSFKLIYKYGNHAVGEIESCTGRFITEYKSFPLQSSAADETAADNHVSQLATLLHNAAQCDGTLSVLKCDYFFKDAERRMYGLVFAMPAGLPKTLEDLLAVATLEPALQVKFRLAKQIFQSVERLHVYQWLHKSLRSKNVYFFGFTEVNSMLEPMLLGFEYSRPVQQASRRMESSDHDENLSRHPERWNLPTCAFSMRHDIYGEFSQRS